MIVDYSICHSLSPLWVINLIYLFIYLFFFADSTGVVKVNVVEMHVYTLFVASIIVSAFASVPDALFFSPTFTARELGNPSGTRHQLGC